MVIKTLQLFFVGKWQLKDVILKEASAAVAIREGHLANTVLNSFDPMTDELASVGPGHGSVALPFISVVVALVPVSRLPKEFSKSMFLIHFVMSLELIEVIFV